MRALIVVPHLDDEVLSTGGLILKLSEDPKSLIVVVSVFGRVYDYGNVSVSESAKEQMAYAQKARSILGYSTLIALNNDEGEPGKVGYYPLLAQIEPIVETIRPEMVVYPSATDNNQDHKHLNAVCRIAFRPGVGSYRTVLESHAFENLKPDFNYYVPLTSAQIEKKLKALRCYKTEVRKSPHPRSALAIKAHHVGMGSRCGCSYAEAYNLVRHRM